MSLLETGLQPRPSLGWDTRGTSTALMKDNLIDSGRGVVWARGQACHSVSQPGVCLGNMPPGPRHWVSETQPYRLKGFVLPCISTRAGVSGATNTPQP